MFTPSQAMNEQMGAAQSEVNVTPLIKKPPTPEPVISLSERLRMEEEER